MIKIAMLLVRKPGMSKQAFRDYWLNVHGPLVMSVPDIRRHVAKYVQCHTTDDWFSFLVGEGPVFDGAAEIWCDSLEEARAMFAEPKVEELIYPDELNFLDMDRFVLLLLEEHLVYERPGSEIHGGIKLFEVPVRRQGLTRRQCHDHWLNVHGPAVLNSPEMIAPLRRYVQSHSLEEPIEGIPPMPYDGLAELWFDSREELEQSFGDQYRERVQPDEANFADLDKCTAFPTKEYVIYERDS